MSDDTTTVNSETVEREDEEREPGSTRSDAQDLGDITGVDTPRERDGQVGVDGDAVAYYRFTLTQAREVRLGLAHREGDADLYLEDASGAVLGRAVDYAPGWEAVVRTLDAGTYYVRVEAQGAEPSVHQFVILTEEPYAAYASLGTIVQVLGLPSFGESSYAFALSEHADGSETGVSLGTVGATDPDGDVLHYSLVGGNESGLFAIDAVSGEVFYVGTGEDFESGAGPYELVVRASDGTHTVDATVTVTVTDAPEAPAFAAPSYAFALAENADGSATRISLGTVQATDPEGDAVRYTLVGGNESELFAIDEASGELFYVGSGEDHEGGSGPYELTVRASDGTHTVDAAVTVTVTDAPEVPAFAASSYAFALVENADGNTTRVPLGTVGAVDPDGDAVRYRLVGGNESGLFTIDTSSGELFYVGSGEDYESGVGPYDLTVRASDGTYTVDATVTVTVTDAPDAPKFTASSYAFALAENTDGSETPVSLGTVTATDPEGDAVRYSLAGGNESGWFTIDEVSGELFYVGPGEDYESTSSRAVTVRGSDGTHTTDTTVTITVADAPEAPAFAESSYAFDLAENANGRTEPVLMGTVSATDPEGDALRYSITGGNVRGKFAVDETSGEVFYVGSGEDYESDITSYELTVRASDGTYTIDTTVTITVTDVRGIEEPAEEDLPADTTTKGVVAVDEDPVTGTLRSSRDRDWFEVTMAPGRTYRFSVERESDGGGLEPEILGFRDSDGNPIPGLGKGRKVEFTIDPNASNTVYYIEVGGGSSGQGSGGARGLGVRGVRGIDIVPRSDKNVATQYSVRSEEITDIGADTSTEGEVSVNGKVNSRIESPGDVDWFAVELVGGRSYRIYLGKDLSDLSTGRLPEDLIRDSYLRGIYDMNGNQLPRTTDDHLGFGWDSLVTFTPTTSGTYFIAAGGDGNHTGNYALQVKEYVDDYPATIATTATVTVDGSATGTIEEWLDVDWFAVELEADHRYRFFVGGRPTDDGSLPDPRLKEIYDADGNAVTYNTQILYSSQILRYSPSLITFTPTESGTYYVPAQNANKYGRGTYTVWVLDATDDFGATTTDSGMVAVGGTVTGEIEITGDRDWFSVALEEGKTYRVDLKGSDSDAGTLGNPRLHGIHDAVGDWIDGTADDDGGVGRDSRILFTADADATYYVSAGSSGSSYALHYYGGWRFHVPFGPSEGTYTLSVEDVTDSM